MLFQPPGRSVTVHLEIPHRYLPDSSNAEGSPKPISAQLKVSTHELEWFSE